jgi:hypothetical protein
MNRIALCICILLTTYTNACLAQGTSTASVAAKETGAAVSSLSREAQPQEEDWTELNAGKSGLGKSAIKAMVLGKSDFPEYSSELVRVQWRINDPIDLYVLLPHGVEKPPVILYLYGFPADTDRFRQSAWGNRVTKGGFAAVGFVSALTGERYHTRPLREWFISELQESLGVSTHDVQMVLDYLATRGDVDATRVGMLGEGSGGAIGILAAAADRRIAFIDAINPWGDWPDWLKESPIIPEKERASYVKPEFLTKVVMLDPVVWLPRLERGRVRIEQVVRDPVTPKSAQAKVVASAPALSVVQYKDRSAQIKAWTQQNWWLKEQMRPSSAPPTTAQVNHDNKTSEH